MKKKPKKKKKKKQEQLELVFLQRPQTNYGVVSIIMNIFNVY